MPLREHVEPSIREKLISGSLTSVSYLVLGVWLLSASDMRHPHNDPDTVHATNPDNSLGSALPHIHATPEEQAELDGLIDACFQKATPQVWARIALFEANHLFQRHLTGEHAEPTMEEMKELMDSMPDDMKPFIIAAVKRIALHPSEGCRVKDHILEKCGTCTSSEEKLDTGDVRPALSETRRLQWTREQCVGFLRACEHFDAGFENELLEVQYAELTQSPTLQQLAQVLK